MINALDAREKHRAEDFLFVSLFWLWHYLGDVIPQAILGIAVVVLLWVSKWNLSIGILRNSDFRLVIFLALLPTVPAIIRFDVITIRELLGNLIIALGFTIFCISRRADAFACKNVFFFFALPLCIWGFIQVHGFNLSLLVSSIGPLERTPLAPLNGTHHFLGIFSTLYFLEAYIKKRVVDCSVAILFISLSGSMAYIIAAVIAVLADQTFRLLCSIRFGRRSQIIGISRLVTIALFILVPIYYFFSVNTTINFLSVNDISRNQDSIYSPFSGRDTLWRFNFQTFLAHPWLGGGSQSVRFDRALNDYYLEDGSRLEAATESYFDYYLARDGIIGSVYLIIWSLFAWKSLRTQRSSSRVLVWFGMMAALYNGFAKNFYSSPALLFIMLLVFAYRLDFSRNSKYGEGLFLSSNTVSKDQVV
ncbi:hypothetical protein KBY57_04220 [Cyanobium sp. Aljojuca 7D2]|uniref:O-antigen ligase family protein n=1 Tax=Cyanobium sp. Aljojuca 7D2 TaxID=2823698 RepID=UPI0020CBF34E|nr:O-antigen ligase family protein [Cyanobium sp. Aljojuca 7D2]MCP9890269.1 hypothetical protein [Cyanobium sp. Aljojuca 7D2]